MRIAEKIARLEEVGQAWFSFEFFPPRTQAGVENLYARIDRLASLEPLFVDVTWGAGGSTKELTLQIAETTQKYSGVDVLMHLTCTGLTKAELKQIVQEARDKGLQNILVLRGDPPKGRTWKAVENGCDHAVDLVRLIREEHGDYFSIGVAGHPEGHAESTSREEEIQHLKEKIEAGADFILTQFFYDVDVFIDYVEAVRGAGINVPVIPGILPIQNYNTFQRMTSICRTRVPPEVPRQLAPIRDDDEAVKRFGVAYAVDMARRLMAANPGGLHFYTLNLERSVREIVSGLTAPTPTPTPPPGDEADGMPPAAPPAPAAGESDQPSGIADVAARRQFPWRASALANRRKEDVRPINWANRPKSYLARTDEWDEFPNGRWGDKRSPAFGELSDQHYFHYAVNEQDRKAMWGDAPQTEAEVAAVFEAYVLGRIPKLPWCEVELQSETGVITNALRDINRFGYMTINSQPPVNGVCSDHPVFGWGGRGGRVYQKAYVECFCSPAHFERLRQAAQKYPSLSYYAVSKDGDASASVDEAGVTALTWGVFPHREVLQPTIFDPQVFLVWAKEAFSLWIDLWATLYDDASRSSELLYEIHDTYYLVALIDHEFVGVGYNDGNPHSAVDDEGNAKGAIWEIFRELGAATQS